MCMFCSIVRQKIPLNAMYWAFKMTNLQNRQA